MVHEEISFKRFLIWSSGSALVCRSIAICSILVAGIKGNNSVKYFFNLDQWFRKEVMSFKEKVNRRTERPWTKEAGRRVITIAHLEPSAQ